MSPDLDDLDLVDELDRGRGLAAGDQLLYQADHLVSRLGQQAVQLDQDGLRRRLARRCAASSF